MPNKYILGIDQSTQGTKALLFDTEGKIICKRIISHDQIVNEIGWVEHNPVQIYKNAISAVKELVAKAVINKSDIVGIGITSQRETVVAWDKETGIPVYNAIVWQCTRGKDICNRIKQYRQLIQSRTGLPLSPYFSAAKIAWLLENVPEAKAKSEKGCLAYGTMDSWLIYKLTGGRSFKTDYSNASRTQLYNIVELQWDQEICDLFGINKEGLAEVCNSNACYGETDFEGFLDQPISIHSVFGDSHAALYGQNCLNQGMIKATYGTGSSVMMNIGYSPVFSENGLATSLAWGMDGNVQYVLEGNINYSGAVISWLKNDLRLIEAATDTESLAYQAKPADTTYLVPAFTGLGAPYWKSEATAILCGMTRLTGKAEIVRAALDSIAYQITSVIDVMRFEAGIGIEELRVDGEPTVNKYLMQFQSDLLNIPVQVPLTKELSGIGCAYATGIAMGFFDTDKASGAIKYKTFKPEMKETERLKKMNGWKNAIGITNL